MSDPNQWVDPLGLMGEKDDKGLFWISDSARKESESQIKKMEQQARSNPNNTKTQLELMQADANKGRVVRANTPAVSSTESERNDFPTINNNIQLGTLNNGGGQVSAGSTVLSRVLPASAGQFETSSQNRQNNKDLANIRNGNLAMVNGAGYAPYALASPLDNTIAYVGASQTAQIALNGGLVSTAIDGGVQTYSSIMCKCNAYNGKQSMGAFIGGTVGGIYTGKMLQAANKANLGTNADEIVKVGILNLHNNLKNVSGQTIWKQSAAIGMATGQISKAVLTDGETIKKPSKEQK